MEACQGLLQVLQHEVQELCANYWAPFSVRDRLEAHHVSPMEACGLYALSLGLETYDQAHSPCAPSAAAVLIGGRTKPYPSLMRQEFWSVILFFVSISRSKPPIYTPHVACAIMDSHPPQMLRVPGYSSLGRSVFWRGDDGAVWRCSPPWLIGWVRQMVILVRSLKTMSCINLRIFYGRSGTVP